jgi:putative sigma-54 modulation protein
MQINLTGHHMDITPALRSYVQSKFERLERHFDQMTNVHVILTVEKERQIAEATIHVNRGNLFADAESSDMYAAIDSLVDKLDRQVKKHKEKINDHRPGEGGLKGQQTIDEA